MRSAELLARHDLVWLDPTGQTGEPTTADAAEGCVLREWIALGRPLVATRRRADTPCGRCDLGLPLPPCRGKRRIALHAPAAAIRETRPPPRLEHILSAAPVDWQGPLHALAGAATSCGSRVAH